jgi:hypothetical protein
LKSSERWQLVIAVSISLGDMASARTKFATSSSAESGDGYMLPEFSEFPKVLYREGMDLVWEGRQLATRIVADAEAEAKAIEEGWRSIETFLAAKAEVIVKAVKKGAK